MNPRESCGYQDPMYAYVFLVVGESPSPEVKLTAGLAIERLRDLSRKNPGKMVRVARLEAFAFVPETCPQVTYY